MSVFPRCPEHCRREYPGPVVHVVVRNIRQHPDIREIQLQRAFLVCPDPPSSQFQRIAADVRLIDFQCLEQSGQGSRAGALTYRLNHYIYVWKIHLIVHRHCTKISGPPTCNPACRPQVRETVEGSRLVITTINRQAHGDAPNRINRTGKIDSQFMTVDTPDVNLTRKPRFHGVTSIQSGESLPDFLALHGKSQFIRQRSSVCRTAFFDSPEDHIGQNPGSVIQVVIGDVVQQPDILELQLEHILLVSPYPHSSQIERIAAKGGLVDFQVKEQPGQGSRTGVLTYRLDHYINIRKFHAVVHPYGQSGESPLGCSAGRGNGT